ncbi:MAG: hypothetical protein M1823_003617 [Watsoniomyces obsoletus]|nr:MAG: hypothetical protein M1823_003617 [Watsoniomyces obsoletus]
MEPVRWTSIPKPAYIDPERDPATFNDGAMFMRLSDELIFFGGALGNTPANPKVPPPQGSWRYSLMSKSWTKTGFRGQRVQRIHVGSTVRSSKGVGFYLGGSISPRSDPIYNAVKDAPTYIVSGLVRLDEEQLSFTNESTVGMNPTGTITAGHAALIETLGREGVLIAFGGITAPPGTRVGFASVDVVDDNVHNAMDMISVYDIANKKWYRQPATGDVPRWRYTGCAVAVSAPDQSSHSIYLFGGWGGSESNSDGNVYVLSIPSFRWIKVAEAGTLRNKHTCHVVGKHTMLVVGGVRPTNRRVWGDSPDTCDDSSGPFAQGLGIFNLRNHTWLNTFDASDQSEYELSSSITDVIGGTARGNATLTEPAKGFNETEFATLMGIKAKLVTNTTPSSPSSSSSSSAVPASASSNNNNQKKKKSSQKPGRTIGIAVSATVAVASALGIVIFLLMRRRNTKKEQTQGENMTSDSVSITEYYSQPHPEMELDAERSAKMELSAETGYSELETRKQVPPGQNRPLYELDSRI